MKPINKYLIRKKNENSVLSMIIKKGLVSRADIAKELDLNKATISAIVQTLLERRLVCEEGIGDSNGGRKPIMLKFCETAGFSIGIDIRVDYISSVLTCLDGTIISKYNIDVDHITKKNILYYINKTIQYFHSSMPTTHYGIVGLGLGIHGTVEDNNIKFTPYYDLEKFPLANKLIKEINIPVYIENEANLSAIAEKNAGIDENNIICINVHSGVGAGLILNDNLFHGFNGSSGEIGHTIVLNGGKPCPCGNQGCLEQYVSELAILNLYKQKKDLQNLDFNQFKNDILIGEKVAIEILDEFIIYISIAINNLNNTFNPEKIIINSRFTNEIDGTIEKIKNHLHSTINNKVIITSSNLKGNSTAIGASLLSSEQFLFNGLIS
ncbi:ROK family transcriptional regulator [Clostridium uliginosum]|uniref:Sugar kinase of the NBD/HSP70 family, may contain an N-terminal HTH domain n=1 Tax=Clostridium uliginosum TaxID=119641 RepID=A0A1I1I4I2_9CLOT|nr:ROK family transcriptional regulator [Clostridium uliginosum]SFC28603.1 Sugar kinase of the NBD/HSP70 family, may contain an N-terminal HTH domain [Clostridium uliginosum]